MLIVTGNQNLNGNYHTNQEQFKSDKWLTHTDRWNDR